MEWRQDKDCLWKIQVSTYKYTIINFINLHTLYLGSTYTLRWEGWLRIQWSYGVAVITQDFEEIFSKVILKPEFESR